MVVKDRILSQFFKVFRGTEMKRVNPSAERNREHILKVLQSSLDPAKHKKCLEIASGSGTHVDFFAHHLPQVTWQPSDCESEHLASLRAYGAEHDNILEPVIIDASKTIDVK